MVPQLIDIFQARARDANECCCQHNVFTLTVHSQKWPCGWPTLPCFGNQNCIIMLSISSEFTWIVKQHPCFKSGLFPGCILTSTGDYIYSKLCACRDYSSKGSFVDVFWALSHYSRFFYFLLICRCDTPNYLMITTQFTQFEGYQYQ